MAEDRLSGEKIFPPFPQTIEEARLKGHVAKSTYLSTAVLIFSIGIYLKFFGSKLLHDFQNLWKELFLIQPVDDISEIFRMLKLAVSCFYVFIPMLIILFGLSVFINILQSGFIFTSIPFEPQLERLDFFGGISRIFSRRNFVRISVGIVVVFVILASILLWLISKFTLLLSMANFDFFSVVNFFGSNVVNLIVIIGFILVLISIFDYLYQRWEYIQDLYLTKSEYMEELKRFEGDPRIKEQWRRLHRELIRQAALKEVPKATVVVTNPTHYAVALEYKITMIAPKVIAKGKGIIAMKIKEIARKHDIPIVEKPELARLLYKLNVGQYVPRELYMAVLEVIRYVYMLKPQLLGVEK